MYDIDEKHINLFFSGETNFFEKKQLSYGIIGLFLKEYIMGKILKILAVAAAVVLAGFGVYCLTKGSAAEDDSSV